MGSIQKSLGIPEEIASVIEEAAEAAGRGFSAVANEFLAEAAKMRPLP